MWFLSWGPFEISNCLPVPFIPLPLSLRPPSLSPALRSLSVLPRSLFGFHPLHPCADSSLTLPLFIIIAGHVLLLTSAALTLLSSLIMSRCPTCCPTPPLAWSCHDVDLCCQHECLQLLLWVTKQRTAPLNKLNCCLWCSPSPLRHKQACTQRGARWSIGDSLFEQCVSPLSPKTLAQMHIITGLHALNTKKAVTKVWRFILLTPVL